MRRDTFVNPQKDEPIRQTQADIDHYCEKCSEYLELYIDKFFHTTKAPIPTKEVITIHHKAPQLEQALKAVVDELTSISETKFFELEPPPIIRRNGPKSFSVEVKIRFMEAGQWGQIR